MSTDEASVGDDIPQSVYERLDELESELESEREQRRQLEDRVDELESQPEIDIDEHASIGEFVITSNSGNVLPLGNIITGKAPASDVEYLKEDVQKLLDGEADVIVRSETSRDALPIESSVAQRQNGTGGLSANEERATLVFPKFGGQAKSWNGKMHLDSDGVRTILDDQTDRAKDDWNYNTIKRVMKQLATLTSTKSEAERSAMDADNLITLEKGDKRLELVADREDWMEFLTEAAED